MEKKLNYFLCSNAVIEFAKPDEVSKPFKSGYSYDKDDSYFVAKIDFTSVELHFKTLTEDKQFNFWCHECVGGTMDVSKITMSGCRMNGLFFEIENKIGLTSEYNIAMTIKNLSERFNCTPIEFINKIARK